MPVVLKTDPILKKIFVPALSAALITFALLAAIGAGTNILPAVPGLSKVTGRLLLAAGISVFPAFLIFALWIIRGIRNRISIPLCEAVRMAERMAEGDLTCESGQEGSGEMGLLIQSMGRAAGKLAELLGKLSGSISDMNGHAGKLAVAVSQQAAVASQQSASAVEISSTAEEFSASASQIAEHAKSVSEMADKTWEDTKKGAQAIETLILKTSEIHNDNQGSMEEIMNLGRKSKEITKIMELINSIAGQTKLIAFNAALEASSAGETGKRFGVVAAEIRRLADSVTESTGGIESRINEMQESVNRLVILSEKGSKGIQEGLDLSTETAMVLSGIVNNAESTANSSKQISLSTQQQKSASAQLLAAIREIMSGAENTAQSMNQIDLISKELAGSSSALKDTYVEFFGGPGRTGR